MGHHRFKVLLEVTMQDPTQPEDPKDGPIDSVVTAELITEVKANAHPKKGSTEWVVKKVTQRT